MARAPTSPALDALLARRPEEFLWLGPTELAGFFFALGAAPQLVPPSEWMEVVFGDEGPEAETLEELHAAVEPLFELHNEAMDLARNLDRTDLPPWLEIRDPPEANVGGDAPLAGWARGFRYGHLWLEELWKVPLPEEVEREYASALVCLSFFGLDEALPDMLGEMDVDMDSLPRVAQRMVDLLPDAMGTYAMLGRTLEEVLGGEGRPEDQGLDAAVSRDGRTGWSAEGIRTPGTVEPRSRPGRWGPIGRNDACPCGSGRKYKRCCGRMMH